MIGSRDQGKFSHPKIRISVILTMEKIVVMASIMVRVSTTIRTLQVPILFITKMGIIIVMIIINIKMKEILMMVNIRLKNSLPIQV